MLESVWDPDDNACIITKEGWTGITSGSVAVNGCDGTRESKESGVKEGCGTRYSGDGNCEQACGADAACDERAPDSYYDSDMDNYLDLYCGSDCSAFRCNADNNCTRSPKGDMCYYYVDPSGTGHWLLFGSPDQSYEAGSPWQECFDSYDNDCDGKRDCADDRCRGVKNPETGEICCQTNDDYQIRYGVKGKCDSPYGKDNPDTKGYTYTCWWPKCESDDDCPSGQKCYCGVCSATFTSEGW